jgi:glycosyltransferase involved in cell wall biosynthesis
VPRYGADVLGGSEAVMRETAHGFASRGWTVELLTTCARDHYTWRNEYPAGTETVDGIVVRRFPIESTTAMRGRANIEARIQAGEQPEFSEQLAWLDGLFRVPELFHYLVVNADQYDAIVFSPYLFWTTVVGTTVAPRRTIVMPCLHDEAYARLDILQHVLSEPAMLWFLSEPEHQLAHRLARLPERHPVTGAGVDVPEHYDAEGFRARHGIERPYVLYAGRREGGKGWDWLLAAYRRAALDDGVPIDLVTTGVGPVVVPPDIEGRVIDLGFLDEHEVANAFAAADAYVQPSRNESFSRTVMEAWLAGTLVLANAQSDVVRWHCERSGAGLVFADEFELAQCLAFVAAEPKAAAMMAESGRPYVLEHYRHGVVLDAMEASLEELLCASS